MLRRSGVIDDRVIVIIENVVGILSCGQREPTYARTNQTRRDYDDLFFGVEASVFTRNERQIFIQTEPKEGNDSLARIYGENWPGREFNSDWIFIRSDRRFTFRGFDGGWS